MYKWRGGIIYFKLNISHLQIHYYILKFCPSPLFWDIPNVVDFYPKRKMKLLVGYFSFNLIAIKSFHICIFKVATITETKWPLHYTLYCILILMRTRTLFLFYQCLLF